MPGVPSKEISVVKDRLHSLGPVFSKIFSISSAAGLSVGVLHRGQIIHTAHYGRRDVDDLTPPNDDTVYYIASLTKAITASAAAILVEENKLSWDTRIRDVLPAFTRDDEIGQNATVADFLSHRTGITGSNAYWIQRNQKFYMAKDETVDTANHLKAVKPFRNSFHYSNWGYGLVTEIIEQLSGQTYDAYVTEKIFRPLSMTRTKIGLFEQHDKNVACAHTIRDDGTIVKVPLPPQSDKTALAGAGSGKSSIKDLLRMYQAMMEAYSHQTTSQMTATPNLPFPRMVDVFAGHTAIGASNIEDEAYSLGWVRARLPRRLGQIGMNELYLGDYNRLPVIGQESPGKIVYYHQGNLVGMLSAVHLIPETESAVIVMCNSLSFTDAADFVGELITDVLLGTPDVPDYIDLSLQTKDGFLSMYPALVKNVQDGKTETPPTMPLDAYVGQYYNIAGNFVLEISKHEEGLLMVSQGFVEAAYPLQPYDADTFYWPVNREDEMCTHCMFPWTWPDLHRLKFYKNSRGTIDRLAWTHDPAQGPEVFTKRVDIQPQHNGMQQPLDDREL